MHHVIGFSQKTQKYVWPLETAGRLRFDTDNFHSFGYFDLLSPPFNFFSRRDSGSDMSSLNVMCVLRDNDLSAALDALAKLERELADRPSSWTVFLGTIHPPRNAPTIRIEPRIFKHRALALIRLLRSTVKVAVAQDKLLVYGNGVSYRHLCGIKLPPGVVEYS